MFGDVSGDLFDPLLAFEKVLEVDRPLEDLVQLLDVGDAFGLGEIEKFLFHHLMRHEHLVGRQVVVERQRRAVFDAFADRILVEIALVVLACRRS